MILFYIILNGSCLRFIPVGARFEQYPSTVRLPAGRQAVREPFPLDTRLDFQKTTMSNFYRCHE
ncbi:hypothetical protein COS50_04770 [Candidatus Roizmanbacteria bacterium CG03_land_8_20_14_0_80_35_26]|uniref:Uncharacterized protein n=1 Tax=Candidatus Roizmanbacteria bacterium CG03_land_8_20_14_0_80_35_26 TaxID=1974845 RepID=A0A2M7BVE0_9BACT|nr:MAG: hypothetical protein COS50_04770 [Candidatus Roizmanbacteria bacterium CG03_land_8_20_14_0_80_35_26]